MNFNPIIAIFPGLRSNSSSVEQITSGSWFRKSDNNELSVWNYWFHPKILTDIDKSKILKIPIYEYNMMTFNFFQMRVGYFLRQDFFVRDSFFFNIFFGNIGNTFCL